MIAKPTLNWLNISLDNVVLYGKGKKPKKLSKEQSNGFVPYVDIKAFEKGIIGQYADTGSSKIIDEKDVLVVWDGARFGLTGFGMKGAAGSTLMVLRPLLISSKYLYFFISRHYDYINTHPKGTGTPHVNPDIFWKLDFPLSPLNEQKRITVKLDHIMQKFDGVKERLDRIPRIIKRFRQSVLTAAVTGKLTEKWREENPDVESAEVLFDQIQDIKKSLYKEKKIRKPNAPSIIDEVDFEFDVSKMWKWCRLDEITLKMSTGPFGSMLHKSDYITGGFPIVNPMNIIDDSIIPSDKMTLSHATKARLARYELKAGDIVIARRGDLSKCGVVSKNEEGWLCGTGSFLLEVGIEPKYFRFFYISNYCQSILNSDSIGSTMQNLNQKVLSNIPFPLPPIEEQKEIVRQVDKLFTFADKLELHYKKAKEKIDKLPQSVLAKTFRGELVPQDPNDEPAEKLLERIMEEKAKMEAELKKFKKITRKKKTYK